MEVVTRTTRCPTRAPQGLHDAASRARSHEDAEELFHERWAHQLAEGVEYAGNASDYDGRA
jgi:hypothetical protein